MVHRPWFTRVRQPIPLRLVLVVPFVLQTLGVVVLVGYLSYRSGQGTVEGLATHLMEKVGRQVTQKLDFYLQSAHKANQHQLAAIEAGTVTLKNLDQSHRYLILRHRQIDTVTTLLLGTPQGDLRVSHRVSPRDYGVSTRLRPDELPFEAAISKPSNPAINRTYGVDQSGNLGRYLATIENIPVHDRPWYRQAVNTGKPGWTRPFQIGNTDLMAINAYLPFYNHKHQLLGVFAANVSLNQLGGFLRQIKVGRSGEIFIVERNGLLIANSTPERSYSVLGKPDLKGTSRVGTLKFKRRFPDELANPTIRYSYHHLRTVFGNFATLRSPQTLKLQSNGERYFLTLTPYSDNYGLDWLIVTVVPESDFLVDINRNWLTTVLLCLLVSGGAIASGLYAVRQLTAQITQLNQASQDLAAGDLTQRLPITSQVAEVNELARSFNQMADQLQHLFQVKLEAEATRQSEARFQQLAAVIPGMIYTYTRHPDGSQGFDYVSSASRDILELEPAQVIADQTLALGQIHPDDRPAHDAAVAHSVASREPFTCTFRNITPSGQLKWLEANSRPLPHRDGSVTWYGILLDVSERKQAVLSLQQALQELTHHIETSPLATIRWNREFRVEAWSHQAEKMFGWVAAEVVGKHLQDWRFVFEEDWNQVNPTIAQLLKGNSTVSHNRNYRKDGAIVYCEWYNSALVDEQGNLVSILSLGLDVTDRKQAEVDRKHAEIALQRYERIVSATSDAISLVDRQYRYQIVNQAYLDWNQKVYTEIVGHTVSELVGQEVFETIIQPRLDRCLAGETVQYNEWFDLSALGRQFLSVTYSPYREADQPISGVVVSVRNLTPLKQAEETVQQSEGRFREIAQTISQLFFVRSAATGEFIYVSPAYERIWGLSCESLYQNPQSWQEAIHPDDRSLVAHSITEQFAGNSVSREYRIIRPDGEIRWISAKVALVRDEAGNLLRFIGFAEDISDRKAAEFALQQSEARYLAILESQTELIIRFKFDGTLLFVNDAYCRYFGVSREQSQRGFNYKLMVYPEDQPAIDRCLASLSPENPVGVVENRVFTRDTVRWTQWTNRAIYDPQGRLIEFQSVGRDIDDRKQAEFQLQAALAEKEVLLQEVYHRVKNNLQLIQSMLQLQQRRLDNPDAIKALQDSLNRVMTISLVHEILYQSDNLAQINLGEYVYALVQHVAASYRSIAPAVVIKTEVQSIIVPIRKAICCGFILNELVTNALKYAFPGEKTGQIMVEVSLDRTQPGHTITMTVKDDGIGLPQSIHLCKAKTLGLNLVQDFVDQLQGTLAVESSQGALFRITFNLNHEPIPGRQ